MGRAVPRQRKWSRWLLHNSPPLQMHEGGDHDHDDGDDGDDGDDDDGLVGDGPGGGRTCSWLLAKKGWGALGGRAGLYG